MSAFPYVYAWNRMGRKGQRCNVTARGKMNSCRVEFEDGIKAITSRNAIRRGKSIDERTLDARYSGTVGHRDRTN